MNATLRWIVFLATLRGIAYLTTKGMPPPRDTLTIAAAIIGAAIVYRIIKRAERQPPPGSLSDHPLTEKEHHP